MAGGQERGGPCGEQELGAGRGGDRAEQSGETDQAAGVYGLTVRLQWWSSLPQHETDACRDFIY